MAGDCDEKLTPSEHHLHILLSLATGVELLRRPALLQDALEHLDLILHLDGVEQVGTGHEEECWEETDVPKLTDPMHRMEDDGSTTASRLGRDISRSRTSPA